jgi:hypothetical protein
LIQEKQGSCRGRSAGPHDRLPAHAGTARAAASLESKAYLPRAAHRFVTQPVLVSVLDLEQYRLRGPIPKDLASDASLLGGTGNTDVVSLYDVNSVRLDQTIKRCKTQRLMM